MNYDNFKYHIRREEVYSNELNVILTKTPPKIFKILLIIISAVLLLLLVSAYTIKQKEASTFKCFVSQKNNTTQLTFYAGEAFVAKLDHVKETVLINPLIKCQTRLAYDAVQKSSFFEYEGRRFADIDSLRNAVSDPSKIALTYRIDIFIAHTPVIDSCFKNGQSSGYIRFVTGERRLINKYLHIF